MSNVRGGRRHEVRPGVVNRTIKNEDSELLQEALEPYYIHEVGGKRMTTMLTIKLMTTIRNCHFVDNAIRLAIGNRNRSTVVLRCKRGRLAPASVDFDDEAGEARNSPIDHEILANSLLTLSFHPPTPLCLNPASCLSGHIIP